MLVLETIRKRNVYENEKFYSQRFWPQFRNICRAGFFRIATFSEHLSPTACQCSMFLLLTKIKSQNIKVTDDKKSVSNLRAN